MKNDLMLKKYSKEFDKGTKNMKELKSYFGSKLIDIEDNILIDNTAIQYNELQDGINDGFQYYNIDKLGGTEVPVVKDLTELKHQYHTIETLTQNIQDLENNTKWLINIDIKNILREYLFTRIKEARSFKTIKKADTKSKNINLSIYKFIDINVLDRYELDTIDFYVKYEDILRSSTIYKTKLSQYNIQFDDTIYDLTYLRKDFSLIKRDQIENLEPIKIIYAQTKSSLDYKLNYYFNIKYKKI
jgi:hypothetical protein